MGKSQRCRKIALSMAHDELLGMYEDGSRLYDKMNAAGSVSEADDRAIMNELMSIIEGLDEKWRELHKAEEE